MVTLTPIFATYAINDTITRWTLVYSTTERTAFVHRRFDFAVYVFVVSRASGGDGILGIL